MNDESSSFNNISNSSNAFQLLLQPYVDAAASCQNSAAMRAVVSKALQESELFAGYDQIKAALLNATASGGGIGSSNSISVDAKIINTLDLFSYGTLSDYHQRLENYDPYMPLTESQLSKLRQLTVLSLIETACQQRQNIVPYTAIQQALWMNHSNTEQQQQQQRLRETEHILSQLLAARVVVGKLSQKKAAFILYSTSGILVRPRDVHPSTVANLLQALQQMRVRLLESNETICQQQESVWQALESEAAVLRQAEIKWKADSGNNSNNKTYAIMQHLVGEHGMGTVVGDTAFADAPAASSRSSWMPRRPKRNRGGFTNRSNSSTS